MSLKYFVIGVSGVTCGGKTTLTTLLRRTFPWARVVHQDSYFYDDDYPGHIRVPDVQNHVNYEIAEAMDMPKMHSDLAKILSELPQTELVDNSTGDAPPNFDAASVSLLQSVETSEVNMSKYRDIPILIVEGFSMFESQTIFDLCDTRFFVTLEETECRRRRYGRVYTPPDCEGYFDKIIWPEYLAHYAKYIDKRPGIKVFNGDMPIKIIFNECVQIIKCRLEEKYFRDNC